MPDSLLQDAELPHDRVWLVFSNSMRKQLAELCGNFDQSFGPNSTHISASHHPHPRTCRRRGHACLSARTCRMLVGACNPIEIPLVTLVGFYTVGSGAVKVGSQHAFIVPPF